MSNLNSVTFSGMTKSAVNTFEVKRLGFFGLKHNVNVNCTDGSFQYVYDASQYDPPARTEYFSDKTTISGFKPGKWYYNARNVYDEARKGG